jgi:sec-independent protein translocase protein TatC
VTTGIPESPDEETGGPLPPGRQPMGFLDHLEELRWTLLKCAAVFAVFVSLIAYRLEDATALLNWPLQQVQADFPRLQTDLITNSPMGVFSVIIDLCVLGGVVLSMPFWLYFAGRFVSPALTPRELRVIVPTGLSALALFLGGAAFGYYLLTPGTIRVAFELNEQMGYTVLWTADKYYSLLLWLVLGMGAAFEFPLLVVLAVYLGLVEVATLRRYRKHAIVAMFVISAIVTPTPDPLNQTLFAAPLILLYEVAILIAAQIKRRRRDEAVEG